MWDYYSDHPTSGKQDGLSCLGWISCLGRMDYNGLGCCCFFTQICKHIIFQRTLMRGWLRFQVTALLIVILSHKKNIMEKFYYGFCFLGKQLSFSYLIINLLIYSQFLKVLPAFNCLCINCCLTLNNFSCDLKGRNFQKRETKRCIFPAQVKEPKLTFLLFW